jgi:hypothetical protein
MRYGRYKSLHTRVASSSRMSFTRAELRFQVEVAPKYAPTAISDAY